jgi:E3 ubiquitin-protein ligase HECTD2
VTKKRDDLKKKLRVTFVGEHGLDMGGLTKEWFLLLLRQIFLPDYGIELFFKSIFITSFLRYVCLL